MKREVFNHLASQAGFDVEALTAPHPGGFPREDVLVLESFAELIIRECAKFLDENSELDQCNNNVWFPDPDELLKHFGIEK